MVKVILAMLIVHRLVALFLAGYTVVLATVTLEACVENNQMEISSQPDCVDELFCALACNALKKDVVPLQGEDSAERLAADKAKVRFIFGKLKEYGVGNMLELGLSQEECERRIGEYYNAFDKLPGELIYKMLLVEDEQIRFSLVNLRGMIKLAANPHRMTEIEDSLGGLSWVEGAGLCSNIVIPSQGFRNMPRKAILAFMASNSPWNSYLGEPSPYDLDWTAIFGSTIEDDYAGGWKYLTAQAVQYAHHQGQLSYDTITRLILDWPSKSQGRRRVLDRFFRLVYVERIVIQAGADTGALENLRSGLKAFGNALFPLQVLATLGKSTSAGNLRAMVSRVPMGMSEDVARDIYGKDPLKALDQTTVTSELEASLDAWNALIDSEYAYNPYCKLLLLIRHLDILPDKVLWCRLRAITNKGRDPLPVTLVDELARNLNASVYRLTLDFLKNSIYLLSKGEPLFAIRYAIGREWPYAYSLPRMILADVSKMDMREAASGLVRNYSAWLKDKAMPVINFTLPDLDLQLDVADTIKQLLQLYPPFTVSLLFCRSDGQILTDAEVNTRLLEYVTFLFRPDGPRALLWHPSGGYFPAHGLDQDFIRILKLLFERSFSTDHIDIKFKISPKYFERLQKSEGSPVTVGDVYGDLLKEGQDIMAAPEYSQPNVGYTGVWYEVTDLSTIGFMDAFHSVLFNGGLEESIRNDVEGNEAEKDASLINE